MFSKSRTINFFDRIQHAIRSEPLLAVCAIVGVVLATIGIGYGLPFHVIGDEESIIGGAMKMVELRNFIPSLRPAEFQFFYYPPLLAYLVLIFSAPLLLGMILASGGQLNSVYYALAVDQTGIWICARLVSVAASVVMILVVFKIAKILFDRRAAIWTAALLSVSFMHSNAAHWMRHWMVATVAGYTAIYIALRYVRSTDQRKWAPAIAAGVAVGFSYISGFALLVIAGIVFMYRKDIPNLMRYCVISFCIFICTASIFIALHIGELFALIGPEGSTTATKSLPDFANVGIGYMAGVLLQQDMLIFAAAVAALLLVRQYRRYNIGIFFFSICYCAVLYLFFHAEVRYVYFIIPALALAAGVFFAHLSRVFRVFGTLAGVLVLLYMGAVVIRYDLLLIAPDTRQLAAQWITENAVDTEFILDSSSIVLPRDQESLRRETEWARLRAPERYALNHIDTFSPSQKKFYRYTNFHFWNNLTESSVEGYRKQYSPRYFVLEYWSPTDRSERAIQIAESAKKIVEFRQSELPVNYDVAGNYYTANSVVFVLNRLGPTIEIYQL